MIKKQSLTISNLKVLLIALALYFLHFGVFKLVAMPTALYLSLLIHILFLACNVHLLLAEIRTETIKSKLLTVVFYCLNVVFFLAILLTLAIAVFALLYVIP